MDKKELMKRIGKRVTDNDKFVELVGLTLVDIDEGYCKGELVIENKHTNPLGTIHGGCLYTLADTVGGFAASSMGMPSPTLSGNMYFLRPAMGMKKLTCEAHVIKNGKRVRVVDTVIYGDNGEEVARCLLEYMDVQKNLLKDSDGQQQ